MQVGDRTLGTYEVSGVHQNVQGEATTDMAMRCLGIYDVVGKAREEHGACTFTDNDGDKIMATYVRKTAEGGTETLVAGTGKFAGISGTGEWTVLKFPLKADDKLSRGIVSEKVHWKITSNTTPVAAAEPSPHRSATILWRRSAPKGPHARRWRRATGARIPGTGFPGVDDRTRLLRRFSGPRS